MFPLTFFKSALLKRSLLVYDLFLPIHFQAMFALHSKQTFIVFALGLFSPGTKPVCIRYAESVRVQYILALILASY